jgi:hypothetical protein
MDSNVLTAAIGAGAAVATAIVAILANHKGFSLLDKRIDDQAPRIDAMAQDVREIRADQKQFFQIQADFDKRLGRIEDKLGIPPR